MKKKNNKNQLSKREIEENARQKQAASDRRAFLLLGAAVTLILLIVGASLLYNKLSGEYGSNQLVTLTPNTSAETESDAEGDTETADSDVTVGSELQTSEETDAETDTHIGGTMGGETEAPIKGEMQYDFTMYDEYKNEIKLSDYLGKPIVLNFWASWCGPCKTEMPDFNEKYLEMGEDVIFIMLNATAGNDTVENARAYVKSQGFSFPVFYDLTGEAMQVYGISSFPTTFFIDKNGNLVAYANGVLDMDTLGQGIDMITK